MKPSSIHPANAELLYEFCQANHLHSIPMLGIIICKMKKMKFEQAFALAKEIGIDKEMRAKVMEQNYEKEYKLYLRSKKIKGFFKSIFRVFLPKDKDNTDKKNADKKK